MQSFIILISLNLIGDLFKDLIVLFGVLKEGVYNA